MSMDSMDSMTQTWDMDGHRYEVRSPIIGSEDYPSGSVRLIYGEHRWYVDDVDVGSRERFAELIQPAKEKWRGVLATD